ncbi:MAG: phosphoribosylglycinamide formyltransferase [Oscillospiraceae bacterium]|jgi:phosphoribosylglycinamide formyltransferase-1|nr:phosphoribosylglycinamide formyltransferase [Oscillospiraceae bacterium]
MVRTAVLVSGGGLNLQALIDASMFGEMPDCGLSAVISSNPDAYALKRAERAGIPAYVVDRALFPSQTVFGFAILDKLRDLDIELVVLAGFNCELTQPILKHYSGRIIDTYSSLVPAFTDAGLSGQGIQEAALAAGVKLSGATVHFVADDPNARAIILQKAVAVRENDTPASLQLRILEEAESLILPRAVALFCAGRLSFANGAVHIAGDQSAGIETLTK